MDIISYERVIQQLSFSEAIQVMKRCFAELQKGKISQSERHVEVLPDGENQNLFALMPAYLGKNRFLGQKSLQLFQKIHKKIWPHILVKFYCLIVLLEDQLR